MQPGDGHMGAGESWMLYSQRGVVFSGVEFGQTRTFVCSVDRVMSVVVFNVECSEVMWEPPDGNSGWARGVPAGTTREPGKKTQFT